MLCLQIALICNVEATGSSITYPSKEESLIVIGIGDPYPHRLLKKNTTNILFAYLSLLRVARFPTFSLTSHTFSATCGLGCPLKCLAKNRSSYGTNKTLMVPCKFFLENL